METCEWCGTEIGKTKFVASVNGSERKVCRICFFHHLKGENDRLIDRVMQYQKDEIYPSTGDEKDPYTDLFISP